MRSLAALLFACTCAVAGQDAKPEVRIGAVRVPGNVFGDADAEFQFRVESTRAVKGRLVWRVAEGTATVKHGEVPLDIAANKPTDVAVKVAIPPVKEGVVADWKLTVTVVEAKAVATFEQALWVFPKNPFHDRTEWLKKLKINLFDPKGDTAKVLTAAGVPFEEINSVEALADVKEGLVITGEGVAFKDEKGLGPALVKLATGGVPVLVLAPAAGEMTIPGLAGPAGGFEDLCFRRDMVRKLDKRLDPDGWLPDGKAVTSSLAIKADEAAGGAEVIAGPGGWPWAEVGHGTGKDKGRWLFCGLAVVAKWEAGPTPRFLLAKMLAYLTDTDTDQPKKE